MPTKQLGIQVAPSYTVILLALKVTDKLLISMQLEKCNPYGRINSADIVEFEETNEVSLPNDYKDFLLKCNGGRPNPNLLQDHDTDVQWLFSMVEKPSWASFFHALDVYEGRIPAWYIPIGTDSGGNLYIMSLYEENKGVVALWLHEYEAKENETDYFDNLTHVADSFAEFTDLLTK